MSRAAAKTLKDHIFFDHAEFHRRETRSSRNALKRDFERVMEAIPTGLVDTSALLSAEIPLKELPEQFPALAADRERPIKAFVSP